MSSAILLNKSLSPRSTMYHLLREPVMFPTADTTARFLNGD